MSWWSDFFGERGGQTMETGTPEQNAARSALMQFMQSGMLGPYQAGREYGGAFGNYEMSDAEKLSQSKLMELLNSQLPQSFRNAQSEFQSVLDGKYDPNDPTGVYQGYKTNTLYNQQKAQDALNRNLAVTGDTYSSNRARSSADLGAQTTNALNSKLAELYQNYSGQRLGAASQLGTMGLQEEGLNQGRINLGSTVGSLPRLLKDAEAKAKYADFLRKQQEQSGVIGAANTLFNQDQRNGPTSITSPRAPSTFMSMLGEFSPLIGSYNNQNYGYSNNQTSINDALQSLLKMLQSGGGL